MKRIIALIICVMMFLSLVACSAPADPVENETGEDLADTETELNNDRKFEPGTYTVEVMGHNGRFNMDVIFDEDSIVDIIVGENNESGFMGTMAINDMVSKILERQSLEVDALSGATVTGSVVRGGVAQALTEAGGNVDDLMIPPEPDTRAWEDTTADVVVVGSGAAGMAATIQAEELGMDVILVEQLGLIGGSSVRAGYMVGGDTIVQKNQGIDFSVQDWVDIMVKSRDTTDIGLYQEASSLRMARNAGKNIDWLYELGVEFGPVNLEWQHYGPDGARVGPYAMSAFQKALDERDIDYRLNTRATKIIMEDGAVKGITVISPNDIEYNIYADAVILATGGKIRS